METLVTLFGVVMWAILSAFTLTVALCIVTGIGYVSIGKLKNLCFINYARQEQLKTALVYFIITCSFVGAIVLNNLWLKPGLDGLYHLVFYLIAILGALIPTAVIGSLIHDLLFRGQ